MKPKTLFEKIWDTHVVKTIEEGPSVLYIDKHFIHEVTSPQAFKGLEDGVFLYSGRNKSSLLQITMYQLKINTCPLKKHFHASRWIHLKRIVKNLASNSLVLDILIRESCM